MITKKEFYFVRHGQTDHNVMEGKDKGDHPADIPLNAVGRNQALLIEPTIALLPVQTICASPLKRVQETKEIAAARLELPHYNIENLGECSAAIWKEMSVHGMYAPLPENGEARLFIDRVRDGLNHALSLPGPCLIVAHGGVHWATCCLMGLKDHNWSANNCDIVHFSLSEKGNWVSRKLT